MPIEFPDLETCRHCGGELRLGAYISSKYCSGRCRTAAWRQRMRAKLEIIARYERGRPPEPELEDPPPPVELPQLPAQIEAAAIAPFDVFDLDPEPWPGFNGSTR